MDAYEDLEGGEEVDYDYPLDDDFFEDGKSKSYPRLELVAMLLHL